VKREIYDADHESFRDSVRSFLDREVKPSWDKYIEAKQFPREMWLAFGRQGLLSLEIPQQYGGSAAGDFRYNAVLSEELGKVSMSLCSCHGIHAHIVAPYLVELTTEEQRERWLPGFVSGGILTAIAMTEPSGGSDLASLKTTAVRDGDNWILNGSKTFITNGYSADLVVVAARTDPEANADAASRCSASRPTWRASVGDASSTRSARTSPTPPSSASRTSWSPTPT
jgi:alkylation response protein AidB-like acyl-CoA dehydrogenase